MLLRSTLIVCVCVLTYGTHCKSFYKLFLYLVVVVVFVVMVRSFQACRAQNIVSSLKKPGWKRLSYSVPVLSALLSVFFFVFSFRFKLLMEKRVKYVFFFNLVEFSKVNPTVFF